MQLAIQFVTKPQVLDLFCGAGGMSLGFERAGYKITLGVEKERYPRETHTHNFASPCYPDDIEKISEPRVFLDEHGVRQVDVIIGGPPCQGFARVGRGKIRSLLDDWDFVDDPRNQLVKQFVRFVEVLQPIAFVMENVPDIQYYLDGDALLLDKLLTSFRAAGYTTDWRVLQADHYGVPQTRKRLFIVGNRLGYEVHWPEKTHEGRPVTVWEAISDLPVICHGHNQDEIPYRPPEQLTAYQKLMREGASDTLYNHQTRWHNEQDRRAFAWMPEGGKYVDLPKRFKRYRDDIFEDKYKKLYRDRPCWTIEAHIGKDSYRYIYPSRQGERRPHRTISVREAARLQSFQDRFRFTGPFTRQFFQIGNAVPPLLAEAIARTLLPTVRAGIAGENGSPLAEPNEHAGVTVASLSQDLNRVGV